MAVLLWSDVSALIPEMSTIPDPVQVAVLEYINDALAADFFGGEDSITYKNARIYLAAHVATLSTAGSSAPGGPVIAESEGGLSRSYAVILAVASCSTHPETSYGRLYDSLVRGSAGRAGFWA